MAGITLTETAFYSRKTIVYGALGLVVLSVTIFIWQLLASTFKRPPPPRLPTRGFGRLPETKFPKQTTPDFTFSLETPDGKLPDIPNQAKVYFIPQPSSGFLDLDAAKRNAAGIGFTDNPVKVSDTTYSWGASNGRSLTINILTGDLSYSLDPTVNPDLYKNPRLLSPDEAAKTARDFLAKANSFPQDLSSGTIKYTYLKPSDNKLVPAISLSETEFILVSFQRQDYDKLPVLPADPQKSAAWVLVSNSNDENTKVINTEYHFFPADQDKFETYPTKPINEAWKELNSGKFYLAHVNEQHGNQITIRRISLNYFDPQNASEYLEPIYAFEGDSDFMAYVPALDPNSLAP